ncbi:S41 family peptidase [Pontibacter populi]|uniref:S41 family peptidase n=1 Tax=Pontibacter populi TaxID=890055 RepID=A0ABV1RTU2_9BACT
MKMNIKKWLAINGLLFIFSLLITYPAFATNYNPKNKPTITERQAQNLFAFAKAYGFVKYFYPLQKKERINWHYIAATGAQSVLNAEDDTELKQELDRLFNPIAPLLTFHTQPSTNYSSNITSAETYYYNLHQGLGQDKDDLPLLTRKLSGSLYHSSIVAVDNKKYTQLAAAGTILSADSVYTAEISDNLFCSLPLTLTEQAYNSNKAYKRFSKNYKLNLSSHYDQLASIIIFWNIFQHFHPYLDNTIGWDKVFFETIARLSPTTTESEFKQVASNITSSLNDGHASISYSNSTGIYKHTPAPPFETGWIENKLVITKSNVSGTALQQGDIIESINGTDTEVLMNQLKQKISVANQKNRNLVAAERTLNYNLAADKPNTLVITDGSGIKKEVTLDAKTFQFKKETGPAVIKEVEPGIFYLDASRISEKDIKENLESLKQAKGVVFDLRKRPTNAFTSTVLPYFIDQELETGNWSVPNYTFPNQQRLNYKPIAKWHIKPNGETITAQKAFLVGHNTFSFGETCAEIIDHYNIGTIVGENTAGTNGNINFAGAGKLQVLWTGMRVLKRDGSQYHGIGVIPDILVQPTIKDVRQGRDTQLAAAVDHLKTQF